MKNFFYKQNDNKDFLTEVKVKKYINNYLKELQRHFDLSDDRMRVILYRVCRDFSFLNSLTKIMKKWLDMLKSFCNSKRG